MGQNIAYYRVSTRGQDIASQRHTLGGPFDKEFQDEGISGATLAADRPGFKFLLDYAREGDTIYVTAIDRLGRDSIDIQQTVRQLIDKGVTVDVKGLGPIGKGAGEIVLAVLAQVASMERDKITERTAAGRATARASLEATGKTHRGKLSMGRPVATPPDIIRKWRADNSASITETATHFNISTATVKRAYTPQTNS